jgi:diadenosine tetraphosphatase ApaH/serine/threonine PP2A family protein phosphatase
MRIGIFSDVHGNLEALEQVLAVYEGLEIDKYVFLGDVVGYGAQPNECCELVRGRVAHAVIGNHDAAVAGRMDYSYYYPAARQALDWCRSKLSEENLAWLRSLPFEMEDPEVPGTKYTHGNPIEPDAFSYVFAIEQARELLPHKDRLGEVNFMGHSHLCKSFALGEDEAVDVVAQRFGLRRAYRYIITVGSVGQPRDYDNRACAGVYDSVAGTFEYVRVEYDIEAAARKIFDSDLALNFGKRLFLGI